MRKTCRLLPPLLVSLAMAACSVAWLHGGILHYEAEGRLPYYLSKGSLLAKLYDSDYLDLGMFQAPGIKLFFRFS